MEIKRMISSNKNHYKRKNHCNYITIHQTGNNRVGADAENHARFINNGSSVTWHYTVDSKQIIQHFNDTVQCWHAGDGQGAGNTQSIGVELCINSDGDYHRTIDNGVELVKYLMKKHSISLKNVVQHNHWSGKNCPQQLRQGFNGITWNVFKNKIGNVEKPVQNNVDINDLVIRAIRGEFGNGAERKKKLGRHYKQVQDIINNRNSNNVDINDLVTRTIRGEFGNGAVRKRKLGKHYQKVQNIINSKF